MRATAPDSGKRKSNKPVCFVVLLATLCVASAPVLAMDFHEALELEASGNVEGAIEAYRSILTAGTEDSCAVTLHLADLLSDIVEKRSLFEDALQTCTAVVDRHALLRASAKLEEITGNLSAAQTLFQQASFAIPEKKDFDSLLSSALLLFELGEYRSAEAQARGIIETSRGEGKYAAQVLLSRIYYVTEREEKSLLTASQMLAGGAEGLTPAALLWIVEIARLRGDQSLERRADQVLVQKYPGSPEAALSRGDLDYLPSPSVFVGLEYGPLSETAGGDYAEHVDGEPTKVVVQTGSYGVRENAEYAVKDLEDAGFEGTIREIEVGEKLYYRVVLDWVTDENIDGLVQELKEKGFEGFPISE